MARLLMVIVLMTMGCADNQQQAAENDMRNGLGFCEYHTSHYQELSCEDVEK